MCVSQIMLVEEQLRTPRVQLAGETHGPEPSGQLLGVRIGPRQERPQELIGVPSAQHVALVALAVPHHEHLSARRRILRFRTMKNGTTLLFC